MAKARKDAKTGETKTISYGYVGRWNDGTLGWFLPDHASGNVRFVNQPSERGLRNSSKDDRFVLCRITIEQVFAKSGRPITRRGGSKS